MRRYSKAVWGWVGYDAAASGFTTIIMAAFFPALFKTYWSHGVDVTLTTARLGTLVSIASLVVALLAPWLGAIADYRAQKKKFLAIFAVVAMLGLSLLALVPEGSWLLAAGIYAMCLMCYYAANTFYDALLPSVARRESPEIISSLGYSAGYFSGGVLLAVALALTIFPHIFGISHKMMAVRIVFVFVALWWLLLLIILERWVREPQAASNLHHVGRVFVKSWRAVWNTISSLKKNPNLGFFLVAYWLYVDAVVSVIVMAVDYGLSLGFKTNDLIAAILITQFVGFPSAIIGGMLARHLGCKRVIVFMVVIYAITIAWASRMTHVWEFYCLAGMVGIAQGSVQSQSRALFVKLLPIEHSAQYFGFFNLVNKFSAVLGPLMVGWVTFYLHSNRIGILSLLILLILGVLLLLKVKEPRRA